LFFEGLGMRIEIDHFFQKYKWFIAFGAEGLMLFYYLYKGKYKKIIKHYEYKKDHCIQIHPVIVIFFYYLVATGLFFLAGLFYNKDWIFAQ
jgi:hypothetical protein